MLCSLRLLDGYQKLKGVTERRVAYMEETHYLGKKISLNRSESASGARSIKEKSKDLIQEENGYYQLMENYFARIADIKAYLEKAIKTYLSPLTGQSHVRRARLPKPSYCIGKPMPVNNLPLENRRFIGREDVLEAISDKFANGERILLLHGMGGVGKTQIALKYAYAHSDDYDEIAWIDVTSQISIQKSCQDFLQKLNPSLAQATGEAMRSVFLSHFERGRGWLIVYDNADYLDDKDRGSSEGMQTILESYIPKNAGHVLITTRCNADFYGSDDIEVKTFSAETAMAYLAKRTRLIPDDFAERLIERLGYLPLALEYAAAYIRTQQISYEDYIKKWDRNGTRLFDKSNYAEMTVRQAFHITLDKLERSTPEMQAVVQLLQICSVWSSNTIRLDLMYGTEFELLAPLEQMLSDEISRDELVHRVMQYSLIQRDGDHLLMHPLLQEIIRDEMADDIRTTWLDISFQKLFESKCKDIYSYIVDDCNDLTNISCEDFDENNESQINNETILFDTIINLGSVIGHIIRYVSPEAYIDRLDDYVLWAYRIIRDRDDEYYMMYPEKMDFLDLALLSIVDTVRHAPSKVIAWNQPWTDAMMANACQCCGEFDKAVKYTDIFLTTVISSARNLTEGQTTVLTNYVLLCDQVFGQSLNFGSSELLSSIFSVRRTLISMLHQAGNDYRSTVDLDAIFYSRLSETINHSVIFKSLKEPTKGENIRVDANYDIYVTAEGMHASSWEWYKNRLPIADEWFETIEEAESKLPIILANSTTDWQMIVLPWSTYDSDIQRAFFSMLRSKHNYPLITSTRHGQFY